MPLRCEMPPRSRRPRADVRRVRTTASSWITIMTSGLSASLLFQIRLCLFCRGIFGAPCLRVPFDLNTAERVKLANVLLEARQREVTERCPAAHTVELRRAREEFGGALIAMLRGVITLRLDDTRLRDQLDEFRKASETIAEMMKSPAHRGRPRTRRGARATPCTPVSRPKVRPAVRPAYAHLRGRYSASPGRPSSTGSSSRPCRGVRRSHGTCFWPRRGPAAGRTEAAAAKRPQSPPSP